MSETIRFTLPRGGGALLVAVITFGQLTPGLPVGAGVYWTLAAWAARQLGASGEDAAAIAVVTHAAMVATSLAVGGASALVRRGQLRELLRRAGLRRSAGARGCGRPGARAAPRPSRTGPAGRRA